MQNDNMKQILKAYKEILEPLSISQKYTQEILKLGISAIKPYEALDSLKISETFKVFEEQRKLTLLSLTSAQEVSKALRSVFSALPIDVNDLIPSIKILQSTVEKIVEDDNGIYMEEELSNEVYNLLDNVQQQIPVSEKDDSAKPLRKKLTRSEMITIIGTIIIPLLVFLYTIYNDSISNPKTIENNYHIDINVLDENSAKANELIEKLNGDSEQESNR